MKQFISLTNRLLLVGLLALGAGCSKDKPRLSGGGATFIDPMMQKWSNEYASAKGVEVDYKKSGSGNGIQQMTGKVLDFGCTDAPMNKEETGNANKEGGEVIHVPMIMGAVVMVYNLPDVTTPIQLTGPIIADIYRGVIKKWNDPKITAINPNVKLPDLAVTAVYRAESSGTTSIFTEYLAKVSPEFKKEIGESKSPKWPANIGIGQNGNDGIAGHVQRTPGCIGYVEMFYAKSNKLQYASVQNKAGKFVLPEASAVTSAAEAAMKDKPSKEPYTLHELTFSLTDAEGEKSYPICGASYMVLYKKQPSVKGKALVEFVKWATSDGQKFAGELEYAELPQDLRTKIAERLGQVTFE